MGNIVPIRKSRYRLVEITKGSDSWLEIQARMCVNFVDKEEWMVQSQFPNTPENLEACLNQLDNLVAEPITRVIKEL